MIRVLVVDDHAFFRSCLVDMVNASGDIAVVGECRDGGQVLAAVAAAQPDVVLMDVRMPQVSGLDAAAALQCEQPQVRVVLLTSDTAESSRAKADAVGVSGYLFKGADPHLVLDALRQAARTPARRGCAPPVSTWLLPQPTNARTTALNFSGASMWTAWPTPGMMASLDPGMPACS